MKVIQRLPRTLVRAASVGAVMIAATLPLAVANGAGAAGTPATLLATALTLESGTTPTATATASFAQGAYYATSVTPGGTFTFTASQAYPVTDTTVSGRLASGTTLTYNSVAANGTAPTSTVAGSGGNAITAEAASGSNYVITLTSAQALYPGEVLNEYLATMLTGTSAVQNLTVQYGLSAASSGTVLAAGTSTKYALVSASVGAPSTSDAVINAAQHVYDFNNATIGAGSVDTLTLTTGPATYNESPTGYAQFGQGASGTMYIYGTGFAYDNGNVTVTTNAPGFTFSSSQATETQLASDGFGYVSVPFSSSSTTTSNFYSVTVQDNNGTTTALSNAFVVNAPPVVTSISPNTLNQGVTQSVTVTGTGFATSGGAVKLALQASDGTMLQVSNVNVSNATTLTATVNVLNTAGGSATVGAYSATVTNPDGGTSTTASVFTVTGFGITSASPSYVPAPGSANEAVTVTLTGTGFSGGTLQVYYSSGNPIKTIGSATPESAWVTAAPTVTATSITQALSIPASTSNGELSFVYTSGIGAQSTFLNGVGVGQASGNANNVPTVTSVTGGTTLSIGSAATLIVNGTGFAPGATVTLYQSGTTTSDNVSCTAQFLGATQLLCPVLSSAVTTSSIAGPADLVVTNNVGTFASPSTAFANAVTVVGPVITATAPSVLSQGSTNTFTSLSLTGTGFPTTGTVTATFGGLTINGGGSAVVTVNSATSATITFANAGTAETAYASAAKVTVYLTAAGVTTSPTFAIYAGAQVTASSAVYATGTSGVGIGATAVPVTFTGSGFLPGATVTFPAASGATATVTAVTPSSITATVSVASTGTANAYTFTVTNTNGGSGTSGATAFTVDAAPLNTNSKFSQDSVIAGATAATVNVTVGNLSAKTTVKSSSPLLTLGTPSYNSATGTLSFTASAPAITGTTAVGLTLTFVNPDGGTSTQAFSVNPQPTVTGTYYVPTFSTNYEVAIAGTGFESGITATSSNSAYSVLVAGVNSTGTVVTLLVSTTSAATTGTSSNITLTNLDGSTVTFALNGGTAPVPPKPVVFKVFRVFGVAMVGKTVTIKISGSGFYAQPKITSNVAGVKAVVSGDTGTVLTVRVAVAANSPRGVHTFTVRLANGKAATVNYNTK